MNQFLKFIFGIELYMFRTCFLSIIRSLVLYDIYLLLCIQYQTPDDRQKTCPKHVEFYSKNKFEKLVHLFGFITRIYHDARSSECQIPQNMFVIYQRLNKFKLPMKSDDKIVSFRVHLPYFRTQEQHHNERCFIFQFCTANNTRFSKIPFNERKVTVIALKKHNPPIIRGLEL